MGEGHPSRHPAVFWVYNNVLRASDPRGSIERIRNSLSGQPSYEQLDAFATELTEVGSMITADVEASFIELVAESDAA